MKEFVVGSPFTTETELGDDDELLIIACDGVRTLTQPEARFRSMNTHTAFIITHSYGTSLKTKPP